MKRKDLSFSAYNFIYASLTLLVYNFYFWRVFFSTVSVPVFILSIFTSACMLFTLQRLIFWPKTTKIFSIFFIIMNTLASYFIASYHIILNKTTLANIFDTNFFEATEWFGVSFWIYMIAFCGLPICFVLWTRIKFENPVKHLKKTLLTGLLSALLLSICLCYKTDVKIYLKENFNLRYQVVPSSYLSSLVSLGIAKFKKVPALDSTKGMAQHKYWQDEKKNLVIFVLGESARDSNFSLSGYNRDTAAPLRPYLKDMTVFHRTESCGVVTRVSVPCMFSPYDRLSYKEQAIPYTTNVLEILNKNNMDLLWLDNELGCNKVCRNITTEFTCNSRDCSDMSLNEKLKKKIPSFNKDTFVILHQRGSHGPRYDLRVPEEHRKWTPYCERADSQQCTHKQLINAYDNTIYYTSFIVADIIKTLTDLTNEYNPILIYISDHGESLGENGAWGHGGDFKDAPEEQKEVPFFVWMPKSTRKVFGFSQKCLNEKTKQKQSQDVIFHSLLGLFGIKTDVYKENLDIFNGCHP